MTEPALPITSAQFAAVIISLAVVGIIYANAYQCIRVRRRVVAAAGRGGSSIYGASNGRWLAAGCVTFFIMGGILHLAVMITVFVPAFGGATLPVVHDSIVAPIMIIGSVPFGMGVVLCRISERDFHASEGSNAERNAVLGLVIMVALGMLAYVPGIFLAFDGIPDVDWCAIFVCEQAAAEGGP